MVSTVSYGNYDEPRPSRVGLAIVLTVIGVLVLSGIIWGLKVLTSPVTGRGDAYITKNSAENWTKEQARFEGLYAEIVAQDKMIAVYKTAADAAPNDRTARDNYVGTQAACLSIVADYNAAARSYLAEDFRAADLPEQISEFDPNTDCKE